MSLQLLPEQAARMSRLLDGEVSELLASNPDGLANDVIIVANLNGKQVARLPKSQAAMANLATEAELLAWLAPRLPIAVPRPTRVTNDGMLYRLLDGQPVFASETLMLSPACRARIAHSIGVALVALHGISAYGEEWPGQLAEPRSPERARAVWGQAWREIADQVCPLLQRHQRQVAERLADEVERIDFKPCVTHGDLAPYHLLAESTGELAAVLDWGECHRGDPARDLGALLHSYGEEFIADLGQAYPLSPTLLRRARYYAHAAEFMWTLRGITSGEPLWFAAHLGAPRHVVFPWVS